MIDVKRLRSSFVEVEANLARRSIDLSELRRARDLDEQIRELAARRDDIRARVKSVSKDVGAAHKSGDKAKADDLAAQSRSLGEEEAKLALDTQTAEDLLRELLLGIPNEISARTPDGKDETENPVVKEAKPREWAEYQRVPHWVIGEELGILDPVHAVKLSGSMFQMLRGAGATLSRALCQFALDLNADAWEEIRPPSLVKSETATATGHLPKFAEDLYAIEKDDLWTIPTAEVPLTSMSRDEVLAEADLPVRMMAYTPCFRREAGSAGKDTRGLLRVHEFDKVELMAYATPDQAEDMMFEILDRAQRVFDALELQYRVIEICSGDLGQSHHRSFDVEAYAPGVDAWLEISSCSWYSDYQARRANVRYKSEAGGGNHHVHTVNGSALPVPRVLATVLETHRQSDGSVRIPDALRPYMRGLEVIEPK
jgi:seryl-tRNA synthetase